ncbi:hypothetical protein KY290_017345 [Solanum tuberosum]|uniref:Uncharacterized protein n=1 Tax=Solanum tuberosum TaxID=4113 RepID=A0ABQ7VD94_SOLTU|nr:hypothetical protein KY290_017345 [Solanum tuberosum]
MELSITSHGKTSPFADLTKEKKEFKNGMTSKIQTKEYMAVKTTSVKVTTKSKLKEEEAPSQYPREERQRPTLKELEAKVYPFPDSDVPMILDELLAKKVIDLPESKRPEEINKDEIAEANHASVAPNQKKCSKSTFLQFGSLTSIEVDFPRKTLEGSLKIDNHTENEADGWTLVHENAVVPSTLHQCMKYMKDGEVVKIDADINPFTETESYFADAKFYLDSGRSNMEKHTEADSIDLGDSKVQWAAIKMSKKRTKEVSMKLSPSKGDMQTNIDDEQPMFCYIPCERRKKGQSLLEECTQQVHPPKKELSHKTFQDLKEKMTVPVAQVPSFTLEPSKGNTQVGQIKGNFNQKVFTLFEKSGYNFSNPAKLGELTEEVIGYYVTTPKFGLGFNLPEPLRISSKKGKEITSSHYTSTEKTKESKKGKTPQRTSVFECIGRLTSRVSAFERLGRKDERGSSKQVDEYATTSKTYVFHRLGTKRKSLSERRLLEHENQDSCDVTDDKEIHSVFPSHMKRKTVLSITTDGSLKVKKSTIVVTNQFYRETNKEEDETITVGSQMEDSNLTQSSYHITVEEGPDIDDTHDDVQEAPPQLEDGVQSTIDDLKELNIGTLEDPRPIFISALLTPEEERKYFKLLVEFKDVFAWSYREMSGLSPRIAIHHLGIKKGTRPIKQSQRVFRPELVTQIEAEVNKLIEAGFIREVKYLLWISNIVLVKKKNGQIRVCVDFRDLNKECPKDDFPLPIIELMVDATT